MTQNEALTILKTGANVFLTGEPGSGKTHTINEYVEYLQDCDIGVAITASTGIAATHIHGMTIHAWTGIGIATYLSEEDIDRISSREHVVKRITSAKVIIIDEVSMLSAGTLEMADAVCREVRHSREPFGGLQVVFVGDFFQLPPVSRDGRAAFAFASDTWRAVNPIVCYLTEQHRQDDSGFLSVLSAIRAQNFDETHDEHIKTRRITPIEAPSGVTRLFSHNADVDRINVGELQKIEGTAKTFKMESRGSSTLIEGLKRGCLSPEMLTLKIGATVMFTKNNPQSGFVNGTLGTVVGFDSYSTYPEIETSTGERIVAEPMSWQVDDQGRQLAAVTQVPLRLAWAITVHKSQGMSMDAAVIDLSSAFEYGQGYVALSRVRRLSGVYLLGWNRRALEVHPHIAQKDEEFRLRSETAEESFAEMSKEEISSLQNAFIKASGGHSPTESKGKRKKKTKVTASSKSSKKKSDSQPSRLSILREKYPSAYTPWSDEDDMLLRESFLSETSPKKLSDIFGRQPGAIRARLLKLGLIDEEGESAIFL